MDNFQVIDGGVTSPQGFSAGITASGIKSDSSLPDLAMLASEVPCSVAGTFTSNRLKAAPVLVCQEHLQATSGRAQAVVVNSGNANCSTGEQGLANARRMTELAAEKLHISPEMCLVSSTGIIGRQLPIEKVERGIRNLELSRNMGLDFTRAIMTTDTRPKVIALEMEMEGRIVRIAGTTKGAGMIYPNMATMLCYITTDIAADPEFLAGVLKPAVDDSFNMIAVDGDMSTNDTALLFSNGLAGNSPIKPGTPAAEIFTDAVRYITRYLAREIARDGEGATKLMEVNVRGALSRSDARKAARSVTLSPLWQCAFAGSDPNWGRIIAALGASGADLDPRLVDISFGSLKLVESGLTTGFDFAEAKQTMNQSEFKIFIDLHQGDHESTAWGCDLTHGYIDENTSYER